MSEVKISTGLPDSSHSASTFNIPPEAGLLPTKKRAIEKALRRAGRLAQQDQLDQSASLYEQVLAWEPLHFDALFRLGFVRFRQNRITDALGLLITAGQSNPANAIVWLNVSILCDMLGRFSEALTYANKALAIQADYAEALLTRANALKGLNRLSEALESYERALAIKPNYAEALNNYGLTLRDLGHHQAALASYDRAIASDPNFAPFYNNRAAIFAELHRHAEAIQSWDKALELSPNYFEAYGNKGVALSTLKRFDEALSAFERALAINPYHADTWCNRGNTFAELNRVDDALQNYARALEINPNCAEAYSNLGVLLSEHGQVEQATQASLKAIKANPNCARYYYLLGETYRFKPNDGFISQMQKLAQNMAALPVKDQVYLNFALAKAFADIGEPKRSFTFQLAGNAVKRRQLSYDEASVLSIIPRAKAVFTPEMIASKKVAGNPSDAPIFIVGMPRSGSTLVEQILASHPKVQSLGELDNLSQIVLDIHSSNAGGLDFPDAVPFLTEAQLQMAGAEYLRQIKAVAPQAERITDKMLGNFLFAGLIHLILPNARIIHTRRDPIDTCLSCFSKLFVDGVLYSYDLGELGRYYRSYNQMMAHWRAVLPSHVLLNVQYEEVVADLEGEARKIIAHCGLEWDERCLDFHNTERRVRTASKAQVRQPIYGGSIGRKRAIEQEIAPLLEALGTAIE